MESKGNSRVWIFLERGSNMGRVPGFLVTFRVSLASIYGLLSCFLLIFVGSGQNFSSFFSFRQEKLEKEYVKI